MLVLVMAKEPLPGRAKTRLTPPATPEQAAAIAEAALADTLDAAVASAADGVVVALDGRPGPWLPEGVHVVDQRGDTLADRLTAAWADAVGDRTPAIQIGMDTPQAGPDQLDAAMAALAADDVDAVLGQAVDGGWWCIGLPGADERVFRDIPTSRDDTGPRQRERLATLGHRVADLEVLVDVDHFTEALDVARHVPGSRFARAVGAVDATTSEVAP